MDGMIILGIGVGLIALAVVLFTVSMVYRKTAGKRIKRELDKEYEIANL